MNLLKTFAIIVVLVVPPLLPAADVAAQTDPPPFAFSWYSPKAGDVALAPDGSVFVVDRLNRQVLELRRDGRYNGVISTVLGVEVLPVAVEVAANGDLFIVRSPGSDYSRLIKFVWDYSRQFAKPLRGYGEDVTIGSDGNVYVTCTNPSHVSVWSPDGELIERRDGAHSGRLSADDFGHYYQIDEDAHLLQKYDLDGTFLQEWSVPERPKDVDVSPDGSILVSTLSSILRYSDLGVLETQWGTWGEAEGQFQNPIGLATNASGDIYVADYSNDRVQMFGTRLASDSPPPPPPPGPPPPPPPAPWPAMTTGHAASVMLHLAEADADSCLPPGGLPDIVTAGEADPAGGITYHLYLLATPNTMGALDIAGTAGIQVGIEYGGAGEAGPGIVVQDWHLCAVLDFADDDWPASGTGNTITWGKPDCQRTDVAVAGYFTVIAYSPATFSAVPWPNTGLVKVADCRGAEGIPDQELGLDQVGWVSLGGGRRGADANGCNPALEPCGSITPVERTTWGQIKMRYR